MDGTLTFRRKGQPHFGHSLPFFSVDTEEEAEAIQVRFCRRSYDGERYVWTDFEQTLEAGYEAGKRMAEFYELRKARDAG